MQGRPFEEDEVFAAHAGALGTGCRGESVGLAEGVVTKPLSRSVHSSQRPAARDGLLLVVLGLPSFTCCTGLHTERVIREPGTRPCAC